jgi:hypothetical protein
MLKTHRAISKTARCRLQNLFAPLLLDVTISGNRPSSGPSRDMGSIELPPFRGDSTG